MPSLFVFSLFIFKIFIVNNVMLILSITLFNEFAIYINSKMWTSWALFLDWNNNKKASMICFNCFPVDDCLRVMMVYVISLLGYFYCLLLYDLYNFSARTTFCFPNCKPYFNYTVWLLKQMFGLSLTFYNNCLYFILICCSESSDSGLWCLVVHCGTCWILSNFCQLYWNHDFYCNLNLITIFVAPECFSTIKKILDQLSVYLYQITRVYTLFNHWSHGTCFP